MGRLGRSAVQCSALRYTENPRAPATVCTAPNDPPTQPALHAHCTLHPPRLAACPLDAACERSLSLPQRDQIFQTRSWACGNLDSFAWATNAETVWRTTRLGHVVFRLPPVRAACVPSRNVQSSRVQSIRRPLGSSTFQSSYTTQRISPPHTHAHTSGSVTSTCAIRQTFPDSPQQAHAHHRPAGRRLYTHVACESPSGPHRECHPRAGEPALRRPRSELTGR